ncbi:hypothetical protein AGMMS49942_04660 [Spirochaetia bacterium]|nr:hypothetical protein AGMMS49942_04660 [Spirochaetia bacterium]GHV89708.1 hypothetical protein AGMMS50268_02110 [Spirochaetia bacterium]
MYGQFITKADQKLANKNNSCITQQQTTDYLKQIVSSLQPENV